MACANMKQLGWEFQISGPGLNPPWQAATALKAIYELWTVAQADAW